MTYDTVCDDVYCRGDGRTMEHDHVQGTPPAYSDVDGIWPTIVDSLSERTYHYGVSPVEAGVRRTRLAV